MKRWKSILLLAIVFIAGVAAGSVGTRMAARRAVQQAAAHPERAQFAVERSLSRRLRLDAEQRAQLHAVLTDTRGQLAALHQQLQPQVTAVLRQTDQKISALLTSEQRVRYDKIREHGWPGLRNLRGQPAKTPP